jgi:hypothetical protein
MEGKIKIAADFFNEQRLVDNAIINGQLDVYMKYASGKMHPFSTKVPNPEMFENGAVSAKYKAAWEKAQATGDPLGAVEQVPLCFALCLPSFRDEDITSKFEPLTKEEAKQMALEAFAAPQSWFCTIFEHLPVVEKLSVNDTVTIGANTMPLMDIASMRHMVSYFLQYAEGKVDPNKKVIAPEKFKLLPASEGAKPDMVPLAVSIMFESCNGPRVFKKAVDTEKFEGPIDVSGEFGASILYYALAGGMEQFKALARCGIVGELDDFNQLVHKIPDGDINILEVLVTKAAREGLLPDFLKLLVGLGEDCHLKLGGEGLENMLDLGMNAGPKILYEHLTFPDHNDVVIFFHQNKMFAINLAGPDIERILKDMAENPFFKSTADGGMGCMVKATCWDRSGDLAKKIFDAGTFVTKAESLASRAAALDKFAIDAIEVDSLQKEYANHAGADPYGLHILLCLEPVMPNDAQKTELGGEVGFGDGANLAA